MLLKRTDLLNKDGLVFDLPIQATEPRPGPTQAKQWQVFDTHRPHFLFESRRTNLGFFFFLPIYFPDPCFLLTRTGHSLQDD
jgi:hypothetical protein